MGAARAIAEMLPSTRSGAKGAAIRRQNKPGNLATALARGPALKEFSGAMGESRE